MAPWIPRFHLFEIDDQSWFPPSLRVYVQAGLTHAWTTWIPGLQSCSAATLAAEILWRELGASVSSYTYIDFCAGAGGPTPHIERVLNRQLLDATTDRPSSSSQSSATIAVTPPEHDHDYGHPAPPVQSRGGVKFILTDLHPHIEGWERVARESSHLTYITTPVDAAMAPPELFVQDGAEGEGQKGKRRPVFQLFNLAFHHFDDKLARAILKNTVETSHGFRILHYAHHVEPLTTSATRPDHSPSIFELQSRTFSSFVTCILFGFLILLVAPLLYWRSPRVLFFVYVVPVVPFVLIFDGLVSSLRTRTADEVEVLLRTCGAGDTVDWVVRSGSETFLWPCGHLTWIVCTKKGNGEALS